VRTEGFRQIYEKSIYPPNRFPSGKPPRNLADKMGPVSDVFRDIYGRGQFTPPAGLSVDDMPKQHEARIRHAQRVGALRRD
jgi:hypothetical protein